MGRKKTIYVIEEHGGYYDTSWTKIRPWGFATHEEAEKKLLMKGWEKKSWAYGSYYSNPQSGDYDASLAYIKEINIWEQA